MSDPDFPIPWHKRIALAVLIFLAERIARSVVKRTRVVNERKTA